MVPGGSTNANQYYFNFAVRKKYKDLRKYTSCDYKDPDPDSQTRSVEW